MFASRKRKVLKTNKTFSFGSAQISSRRGDLFLSVCVLAVCPVGMGKHPPVVGAGCISLTTLPLVQA